MASASQLRKSFCLLIFYERCLLILRPGSAPGYPAVFCPLKMHPMEIIITEPDELVITYDLENYNGYNVSCFGVSDAFIDLTVTGGSWNGEEYNYITKSYTHKYCLPVAIKYVPVKFTKTINSKRIENTFINPIFIGLTTIQ